MAYIDHKNKNCPKKWKAKIVWDGVPHYLGYYHTQEQAERVECQWLEEQLYGYPPYA